ncbi:Very-long-chain enoyl-CoA reductase [Zalaria obscura]|uniref:Very-long-chain enoyl-CoA reductase n=1 Tax=Zalaria obscura TaxID=2024903 RepID=A0ACC3S647_9PEZI
MASKPITLVVQSRGKPIRKLPKETSTYLQGSTFDLYHRLAAEAGCTVHRLRLTKASDGSVIPNAKDFTIERTGLKSQDTIQVKDLGKLCRQLGSEDDADQILGPQIAWQTVFVIEYLGPLLIHPLIYFLRPYIYSNASSAPSSLQTLSCVLCTLHFLKRELETLYVHRFSNATMPMRNIFKNSAHYWIFAGFNIAYWSYAPTAPTARPGNTPITLLGVALFVIGELGNLNTHLVLRGLRSSGSTERGIPKGLGFNLVTCPNYMFETIAWVGIWLVTWSLSTGIFIVIAVGQMAVWAKKKERRYRKEFPETYRKKRYGMIPGLF